jgi:hypothetical protein
MPRYLEQTIGAFVRATNASGMAIDYLFLDGGSRFSTYAPAAAAAPPLRCASSRRVVMPAARAVCYSRSSAEASERWRSDARTCGDLCLSRPAVGAMCVFVCACLRAPCIRRYAQWRGWKQTVRAIRAGQPGFLVDHRYWFGPWWHVVGGYVRLVSTSPCRAAEAPVSGRNACAAGRVPHCCLQRPQRAVYVHN